MKRLFLLILCALLLSFGTMFLSHSRSPQSVKQAPPESRTIIQSVLAQTDNLNGQGTIENLGFGPSNASRIEEMIKRIKPESPFIGHGDDIIKYAKEFNIDPLMIIVTQKESQLCSDTGANVPGGSDPDNFNCGNITWQAAQDGADVARWHAKEGPRLTYDGHTYVFTFVPSMSDGLGLFFDYLDNPLFKGKTLTEFYETYNSCSNPGNGSSGFACGAKAAQDMLDLLRTYAGTPCSGSDCTIGTTPEGTNFGPSSQLTLKVRPKTADSWVINQAFARVIGAKNTPKDSSGGPSQSSVALVKAAEDIKTAYDTCAARESRPAGDTYERDGLAGCMHENLLALRYSSEDADMFEIRRQGALVPSSRLSPPAEGKCTQCLGFVGTVIALAYKTTDGAKTLSVDPAKILNDTNAGYGEHGFEVGNDHYDQIGSGNAAKIQPGDIAVSSIGDGGHIGIVREVIEGTTTHFGIIESNGYATDSSTDCRVTTDRGPVPKEGYTFYGKR